MSGKARLATCGNVVLTRNSAGTSSMALARPFFYHLSPLGHCRRETHRRAPWQTSPKPVRGASTVNGVSAGKLGLDEA